MTADIRVVGFSCYSSSDLLFCHVLGSCPAQPNKYGTTERLPSKNLRAKTVPPLIDGIEYLTPPPMPFEPAVKRREELFEKEQKEIIEQEKVPNSKETQNEKDIRQTGQKD